MNVIALGSALVAAVAMALDWWWVATDRRRVESVAKPLVMVGLLAVAVASTTDPTSLRTWIIVALTFGLVGDVMLLPQVDRFIEGLGAFLVGHLTYCAVFLLAWDPGPLLAVGVVGMAALLVVFGVPIARSLGGSSLKVPVLAYIGVTTGVILLGAATGRWLVTLGALAFALSDGFLGANRFVSPEPDRRVWVHVLYHSGQAAILAGAIAG